MDHVSQQRPSDGLRPMMSTRFLLRKDPAAFYWLGTRNEQKGCTALLHNAHFHFDESVMQTGHGAFLALAVNSESGAASRSDQRTVLHIGQSS